ncbi:MAG: thioredoxin family protein [Methanobacterium sp.]
MKNPIILLGIIIVILLAVFAVINLGNKTKSDPNNLNWTNDINLALKEAQATNKTVMIDFYSPSCDNCVKLDDVTFKDPNVKQKLTSNYVIVKINVDKNPNLATEYQITSAPVLVFLNSTGQEIKRIQGYKEPGEFINNF